jgi:hypothetical protein
MSAGQRQQLRRNCAMVLASPDSYESDLKGLCGLLNSSSSR